VGWELLAVQQLGLQQLPQLGLLTPDLPLLLLLLRELSLLDLLSTSSPMFPCLTETLN
jgi:hypothetical protein